MRTRVASSDWCASRKVVSVTASGVCARSAAANPAGPSSSSRWREPAGAGAVRSIVGQLVGRVDRRPAPSPFGWLTVTSASQLRILVPRSFETACRARSCGRSSMNEVLRSPAMNAGSSSTACRNGMFVETPRMRNSARARLARATAAGKSRPRQVSFASIESKCGLICAPAAIGAAVEADAGAAGRAVRRDLAGVGPEPGRRVLGGDAALQRGAAQLDARPAARPRSARVSPAAMRICDCTRSTSVTSSVTVCSTWMRGFISMKTCWPARSPAVSSEELDRAGVDVADRLRERDRRRGRAPARTLVGEVRRRARSR